MSITVLSCKPSRKRRPTKHTKTYETLERIHARISKSKKTVFAVWPNPPKTTRARIETLVGLRRRSGLHLGQFTTDSGKVVVFVRRSKGPTGRTLKRTGPRHLRSTTKRSVPLKSTPKSTPK